MSTAGPFYQVHTTFETRGEGGNATHLSRTDGGAPICGAPMKFGCNGTSTTVDQATPWKHTDCGNCQRLARQALDSTSKGA